jgi:hypothetical protein
MAVLPEVVLTGGPICACQTPVKPAHAFTGTHRA